MYRKKRGRDTGLARKSLLNADTEEILNEELCLSLRSTPILTITLLGAMPKSLNLSPGQKCFYKEELKELLVPVKDMQGTKYNLKGLKRHSFHCFKESRINCFRAQRTPQSKSISLILRRLQGRAIEFSRVGANCQVMETHQQGQQYLEKGISAVLWKSQHCFPSPGNLAKYSCALEF